MKNHVWSLYWDHGTGIIKNCAMKCHKLNFVLWDSNPNQMIVISANHWATWTLLHRLVSYVLHCLYTGKEQAVLHCQPQTFFILTIDMCKSKFSQSLPYSRIATTLVLLVEDMTRFWKQCKSRSVGFLKSQLIWICTACHSECESASTT